MTQFGPQLDIETQAIREMLLFQKQAPGGVGFGTVKGRLFKALAKATDNFKSIQAHAQQSQSSQDAEWQQYMMGTEEKGSVLAEVWFKEFADPYWQRIKLGSDVSDLRVKLDQAILSFAHFFILEACKHLAHDLRVKKAFLNADGANARRDAGFAVLDQISGKTQIFAGLQALGYPVSGAMAGDLPAYLGALNGLAVALHAQLPHVDTHNAPVPANQAALDCLCKGDLCLILSDVLETRRREKNHRQKLDADSFTDAVRDLTNVLMNRAKHLEDAQKPRITPRDLSVKDAVHTPRYILKALDLYYAAISGANVPDSVSEAFDASALRDMPWKKLRHHENLRPVSARAPDETDLRDLYDLNASHAEEQALIASGYIQDHDQQEADRRAIIRLSDSEGGQELVAQTLLHKSLPALKQENKGARNGFIISFREPLDDMVNRLKALRERDARVPKTTSPNQSGDPRFDTKNDSRIEPFLEIALAFIADSFKQLHGAPEGETK